MYTDLIKEILEEVVTAILVILVLAALISLF